MPTAQDLYGEVTSPLYPKPYPNNFETTTVITVSTGYRVKLVFWQFDLEPSEGCFYDYVKVGQVGAGRQRESWVALEHEDLCSNHPGYIPHPWTQPQPCKS